MSYSAMFKIILFRTNIRRNSWAEYSSETDMYDIVIISQKPSPSKVYMRDFLGTKAMLYLPGKMSTWHELDNISSPISLL